MKKSEVKKSVEDRIYKKIWNVNENSNQRFSYSSISWSLAGDIMKSFVLTQVYPKKVAKAHVEGDLHIHNLYMGITGYCCGWSLYDLLLKGVGVTGQVCCRPPKHFSSALTQIVNFLGVISNEWSGAQALNSLDVFLAPFVRKDNLTFSKVKQLMQGFIYTLNLPSRWGGQTPFTNITFDMGIPDDLRDKPIVIGGELQQETYGEFQREVEMVNRAFFEIMIEGNSQERVLSFPIPTYNIAKDFAWDSPLADLLFEMAAKYGLPYFQNFLSSDLDPHSIRAMCCHLRLDLEELKYRRVGGFFGYADKTGSIGVVTLNMPRIGYLSKTEDEFFLNVEKGMELAKDALETKRQDIEKRVKIGLLPFTQKYLESFRCHFSTIGLVGFHEACLNFLKKGIETIDGKELAIKVLHFMRDKLKKFQMETGNLYNLEATPAESCGYRLALLDKQRFPEIITAGDKEPYYTNSSWLPVGFTEDVFEALEHQKELQPLYTGGSIFHTFLGERLERDQARHLVKRVLEQYNIPYITLTPTFSICSDHGYLKGEQKICPHCNQETEVYSRVVGFYTPTRNWNKGKQQEFNDREEYTAAPAKKFSLEKCSES